MRTSGGDVCPVAQASILTAIANTTVRHSFRECCVNLTAESSLSAYIGVLLHVVLGQAPVGAGMSFFPLLRNKHAVSCLSESQGHVTNMASVSIGAVQSAVA